MYCAKNGRVDGQKLSYKGFADTDEIKWLFVYLLMTKVKVKYNIKY